jgi:2-polyprenyl-3-methyl-5-hydroxy-6-metoxy-1,4-benzoquinol methylase
MNMKESEIRPLDLFNRYLELCKQDIGRFFKDRSNFVKMACPACSSTEEEPGLEKFGFTYVLCGECGTLYVSPRPSADSLDAYYREAESVRFWSTHFYKETAETRREKMFRPRAQLVSELVARYALPEGATFVDVGSGYGIFLEEVQRLGWFQTVMGIEPNPEMAEICRQRGFPIIQKQAEAVQVGEVQTDFVTAFEVLEHVFEPLDFLIAMRRMLKPGGILLFTTLTVSGFDLQVLWEHSKSIYPPHHINLISVEGIQRLVERAELQPLELSTPGRLDVDIVANMVKENPTLPLPRFVSYLLHARDEATHQDFQRFLSQNRLSSHIRVIAKSAPVM